ncbi:flavin reductase family protein [Actinoplanes sp. TFC3]|uniref:flavin reductase family protein n=1 Tax=Actinoplanes sp. TFC3 TaxID=1710355 RepID=UPI000AA85E6B|nr:flavin reductase family protein [Actinoplanes sp. TFC3]
MTSHDAFRAAMARVPGPVAVATTIDAAGRRWGFTASSFTSLSLEPPLVMVCLGKAASTHAAFTGTGAFLINVLAVDQEGVARQFARSGVDRFTGGDMVPCELGLPGLPGAAARVACDLHTVADGGDHSILIGRVTATFTGAAEPLVYYERTFTRPAAMMRVPG